MTMPPERLVHILADKDCYYCKGDGMEADYEGYPTPMPVYWWPCRCVEAKWTNKVEYFERQEGTQADYDRRPDNWDGEWIPF